MGDIPLLSAIKLGWGLVALAALVLGALVRRGKAPVAAGALGALALLAVTAAFAGWLTGAPWIAAGVAAAAGAAGALWWRRAPAGEGRRKRTGALAFGVLAAAGIAAWTNFGTFHGPGLVHRWDSLHYLLGVRYFEELGYDGLYDCLVAADRAYGHPAGFDPARPHRDLSNDREGIAADAAARIAGCRDRFAPARWEEFCGDVQALRGYFEPGMWRIVTRDHGYNGSPPFTLVGGAMAGAARAATAGRPGGEGRAVARQVIALVLFDAACAIAALALLWWGFGIEAAALASLALGAGEPWGWLWTGGCFGRHLWLLFAAGGLALLGRGRPAAAGAAVGVAVSFKLFPALLLLGPALSWLHRRRAPGARREILRFAAGAAAALLVLSGASAALLGPEAFADFAANIGTLQGAPKGNHLGLPALAAAFLPIAPAGAAEVALSAILFAGVLATWAVASRRLSPGLSAALAPIALLLSTRFLGYYGVFLLLLVPACRGSVRRTGAFGASILACLIPPLLGWGGSTAGRFQTAVLVLGSVAAAVCLWREEGGRNGAR